MHHAFRASTLTTVGYRPCLAGTSAQLARWGRYMGHIADVPAGLAQGSVKKRNQKIGP